MVPSDSPDLPGRPLQRYGAPHRRLVVDLPDALAAACRRIAMQQARPLGHVLRDAVAAWCATQEGSG